MEQKFNEKIENILEKYKKLKNDIIELFNEKINQLQNINLTQEFMEYFKELKDIITNNINEIKKKTKKKISNKYYS